MATHIPHSLDAVIIAVEALIDGRPMPEGWSRAPEPQPAPVAAPPPTQAVFDEILLMQAISDLVDNKIATLPKPEPVVQPASNSELEARVKKLETANEALPPGFSESVLLTLDIQKSQTLKNTDLEMRVAALESIMARLGAAVHKEQAS